MSAFWSWLFDTHYEKRGIDWPRWLLSLEETCLVFSCLACLAICYALTGRKEHYRRRGFIQGNAILGHTLYQITYFWLAVVFGVRCLTMTWPAYNFVVCMTVLLTVSLMATALWSYFPDAWNGEDHD